MKYIFALRQLFLPFPKFLFVENYIVPEIIQFKNIQLKRDLKQYC